MRKDRQTRSPTPRPRRRQNVVQKLPSDADHEGTEPETQFILKTLEELESIGEFNDPMPMSIEMRGKRGRIMAFDALAFDESDKSVVLISNEFKDSVTATLTMTDINKIQTRMLNFLEEAYEGSLEKYFDVYDELPDDMQIMNISYQT